MTTGFTPTFAQAWWLLAAAIVFEIAGTVCMRLSDGLTHVTPSVLIFVFYAVSFALNTFVVRTLGLSVVYAVWSGVGTVVTAAIGIWLLPRAGNGAQAGEHRPGRHRRAGRARRLAHDGLLLRVPTARRCRRRGWPARRRARCPDRPVAPTQRQCTRCACASASSCCHSSAFFTGLRSAVASPAASSRGSIR